MPVIPVTLTDATGFSELPEGTYLAEVSAHVYNPPEDGKQQSIRMGYTVIEEGDQLGATSSQWLYFSEKSIGRTNDHYKKFGLEEGTEFATADDSDDIIEPDLIGVQVIIESYLEKDRRDPNGPKRQRTRLVSVEDDMSEAPEPPKRAAKAAPAEADEDDGDDESDEEEAPAPRRAVATKETPAPRRVASQAAGKRRTLR